MTTKHHLTNAETVYQGKAYYPPLTDSQERNGAPITFLTKIDLGTPDVADVDGVCASQDGTGGAGLLINGALASGGVATLPFPRNLVIDTDSAGDTTQTVTITGTDVYGEVIVETIAFNGVTAVYGLKAFKTITAATLSAALTSAALIGEGPALGLPYRAATKSDVLYANTFFNDIVEATLPTVVAGVDTTATATTGDTRGTVTLNSTLDESQIYTYMVVDTSTKALMVGVDQYGG